MSLADQDVAAALYREQPVVLYYLSHDPALAAQYACDAHVRSGLLSAVTMLSTAWHERFNAAYLPLDSETPYSALFQRRVPAARQGQPTLQADTPDPFYREYSGEASYWLLMGQRIGNPTYADHFNSVWARTAGGNYRWVHAWGVALAAEYQLRFNAAPAELPQLWTLEATPPDLWEDEEGTEPVPLVPPDCVVLEAGYYNVPASYRAYYVAHKQALLKWTRRAPPPWLRLDSAGRYSLTELQGL